MHLPDRAVRALTTPLYRVLDPRVPVTAQRRVSGLAAAVLRPPAGLRVEATTLGGRPAERIGTGAGAILYLHGGGYVVGSPRMYRALAGYLAQAADCTVHVLDYRLAPEHPFPAALDDAVDAARELGAFAICGDSAGGGLAVAAALVLIDAGVRPAALGLISPWTDPADPSVVGRDLVVSDAWLTACAAHYLGGSAPSDPGYAPIGAPLSGLPPTLVHAAEDELLLPQIRRFAARASAAGVEIRTVELAGMWHSGHVLAGMSRRATAAVIEMGTFLRDQLVASRA